ncbi:uncharacterized protein TRAVEDRAFT_22244 [Trametes versicolor FP-101664 SS1]|uniref:uncharacterized protein n=1 Tax=Trametes versicolor (strain FP-101664) TaxID=717944 RepID=UPI00046239CC|nr:uncharacterized protein TRAVEDRAFT_22244 [Trametes versicolor FP-101664 SS1]EIW55806.1 hypothetical protein TRAVEDRAFT_22244 [Trametes versicolor FP-101664 SS1]
MLAATTPLRTARLAALFLTFAFGVIGFATGINALVKSNDQKDLVKNQAPLGAVVTIDTGDVFKVGCVVTAVCAALAALSLASLVLLLFTRPAKSGAALSTRTLPLQGGLFAFLTLWLFAALVAMTDFVANREAKVTAFIGTLQLQPAVIKTVEAQLGVTSVYREIDYLRLAVILPWIAFLFGAISTALSFAAARRARHVSAAPVSAPVAASEPAPSFKGKNEANVEQVQV